MKVDVNWTKTIIMWKEVALVPSIRCSSLYGGKTPESSPQPQAEERLHEQRTLRLCTQVHELKYINVIRNLFVQILGEIKLVNLEIRQTRCQRPTTQITGWARDFRVLACFILVYFCILPECQQTEQTHDFIPKIETYPQFNRIHQRIVAYNSLS